MKRSLVWLVLVAIPLIPNGTSMSGLSPPTFHPGPQEGEADFCAFFWKLFPTDPLKPVMREGSYYGPWDPAPWTRHEGGQTWYYVFHDGQCVDIIPDEVEACAEQVQLQWSIAGDGWLPWFNDCVGIASP